MHAIPAVAKLLLARRSALSTHLSRAISEFAFGARFCAQHIKRSMRGTRFPCLQNHILHQFSMIPEISDFIIGSTLLVKAGLDDRHPEDSPLSFVVTSQTPCKVDIPNATY